MPPSLSRRCLSRRCGNRGDDGFTLVEVLVAFLLIAIIAAAGTSLTVRGLRVTLDAKQLSQAKNLVNEQVEQMRGLPYFVANTTSTSRVDVLDRYYPSTAAAGSPTCAADAATWLANQGAWSGYVAAGSSARCSFEPGTGAFYRSVVDPAVSGSAETAVVVAAQFLGLAVGDGTQPPPVAPFPGYAWNANALDTPATAQLGAFVTAVYGPAGAEAKRTTSRTDIADRHGGPPVVSAETTATAVTVDATPASGVPQRLELGAVAGNGAVTVITKAAVEAVGASMQTDTGRLAGASQLANSPGTLTGSAVGTARSSGGLSIGATSTSGVSATSTVSDPGYGGPAVASAASGSFSFDQARLDLGLTPLTPIVAVDAGGTSGMPGGGSCPAATGSYGAAGAGWMNTGIAAPPTLAACAQSEAATVKLFPMAVAPEGLVQAEADDVVARCEVNGATPAAATSGSLRVRWHTGTLPTTYSAWTTINLNGTTVTGDLPALTTPLGNGKTIGDYIASWAAFSGAEQTQTTTDGRTATARVPAALTLSTAPLRNLGDGTPDPDGAAKVTVGQALCSATDRR